MDNATVSAQRGGRQNLALQDEVIRAIVRLTDQQGYPPSVREIGREVGIASTSHVRATLVRLREAGRIRLYPGIARSITVLDRGNGAGSVAA